MQVLTEPFARETFGFQNRIWLTVSILFPLGLLNDRMSCLVVRAETLHLLLSILVVRSYESGFTSLCGGRTIVVPTQVLLEQPLTFIKYQLTIFDCPLYRSWFINNCDSLSHVARLEENHSKSSL